MASRGAEAAEPVYTTPTWAGNGADENTACPVAGTDMKVGQLARANGVLSWKQNGYATVNMVHVIPIFEISKENLSLSNVSQKGSDLESSCSEAIEICSGRKSTLHNFQLNKSTKCMSCFLSGGWMVIWIGNDKCSCF